MVRQMWRSTLKHKTRFLVLRFAIYILVMGFISFICFGGTLVDEGGGFGGAGYSRYETWEHGWPAVFLVRRVSDLTSSRYAVWDGSPTFMWPPFALDALAFFLVAIVCWYLARPRSNISREIDTSPRFALSSLLLFVALACAALATIGQALATAKREVAAGMALEGQGHSVTYAYGGPVWLARIVGSHEHLGSFYTVKEIRLSDSFDDFVNDDVTAKACDVLSSVRVMRCDRTHITDEYLHKLLIGRAFHGIEEVSFNETAISGKAFVGLNTLAHLRVLEGAGSQINDEGFKAISMISSIEDIDISDTNVSPAGIRHAVNMPRLARLVLLNTQIDGHDCRALASQGITCITE
jgi:hypothetical protein